MSLCIAKIIDGDLFINADSLLSGTGVRRHDVATDTALKAIVLSEKLCLCFAGNPQYMDDVYKLLSTYPKLQLQNLTAFLHYLNKKTDGAVEFILAGFLNFDQPYIYEIKDRKVLSTQSSWIGSKNGFTSFQSVYRNASGSEKKIVDKFEAAFKHVIDDDRVSDVGDFHFSVMTFTTPNIEKHKFLNYRSKVNIYAELQEGETIVSTIMKTETNTNYAVSYVPTKDLLKPGLGIHFGHVNYGLLFNPRSGIKPKIYNNVDGVQFQEEAIKEGIPLIDFPLRIGFNNFHKSS